MIGDPSFKSQERKLNTLDTINHWVERLKEQVSAFIDFNNLTNSAEVVNNYDWTKDMSNFCLLKVSDIGKTKLQNYLQLGFPCFLE